MENTLEQQNQQHGNAENGNTETQQEQNQHHNSSEEIKKQEESAESDEGNLPVAETAPVPTQETQIHAAEQSSAGHDKNEGGIAERHEEEESSLEEEHHEAEEEIDFSHMGKEELLAYVQSAIESPGARNINMRVQQARSEFNRRVKEEKQEAENQWNTEEHEEGAEFQAPEEPLSDVFYHAFKAFKKRRQEYIDDFNKQKDTNLERKGKLLERLKELTEHPETHNSFQEFKKVQDEWRTIGHVPITEAENIWNKYNYYVDKFYEQRSLYSEFKELDRKRNLASKEELVNKVEALFEMEDLSEAMRLLKGLQEEWRHIGPVPKDNLEELMQRYKAANTRLFEKREKHSKEMQQVRELNYQAKVALLEKIEEIGKFESGRVQDWINKNQELGQWIENWRSLGSVPAAKADELKEKFNTAVRSFNQRKNEFFRNRKREKVDNLKVKVELCEKVEKLLEVENPGQHKKEVIRLQDEWKKSGPVPAKYSDKIWKRFQAACDAFFSKAASHVSEKDKEQYDNLAKKNAIIERIEGLTAQEEAIAEAPDRLVRSLQDEFNKIGFVPFKEKDKVRKRFFTALNGLIGKLRPGTEVAEGEGGNMSYQLMIQGWAADPSGDRRLDQERSKQMREIKRIENEIATLENNMEFFRNSKSADALKVNLEKQITQLRGKLKDLNDKLSIIRKAHA